MPQTKDTLIVTLSDMHTGSTQALCPNRFMEFTRQGNNHTPTSKQIKIYEHFEKCAQAVAKARTGKRLLIVNNGDAIEGYHHNLSELMPCSVHEQADLHIELMAQFKRWVDYDGRRGDKMYYTMGTETHVGDWEEYIGEHLGTVQTDTGMYVHNDLMLPVNGRHVWWTHHGPTAGKGQNKGNALRNWLRVQYYEAIQEGKQPPHFIISSHTHNPFIERFTVRNNATYFYVYGMISPSWQKKTRYANGRAPLVRNKVGLQYFTITADEQITDPVEMII